MQSEVFLASICLVVNDERLQPSWRVQRWCFISFLLLFPAKRNASQVTLCCIMLLSFVLFSVIFFDCG